MSNSHVFAMLSVDKIWDIAKAVERVMGTHEDEEAIIVHPCSGLHRAEAGASF